MKLFKRIVLAVATIALLSSCSVLKSVATNALTAGSNTGSAIKGLAEVLKQAGNIDLGSITNIINLGDVIRGAKTAANASTSFLENFSQGLIKGSTNMINNSNVSNVLSGLKALNGMDTSALKSAAIKAAMTGLVNKVSTNDAGVSDALSQVSSIVNLLK
jgi:hypothetical protein